MKKVLFSVFCLFLGMHFVFAEEDLAPNSKSAILIEASTGQILYEKNADEALEPASMTKIMSMLLIMEAIDEGKISLDDMVTISKNASSMGGSQVFLQEGESYKVSELLKGIAVASGNDAVVAMAEKVGGSVEGFVKMMNDRAKKLGLHITNFVNPHGLHAEGHVTSARDMSIMAMELLKHEKILEYTSIYEDYLQKPDGSSIWLVNTNKLVRFYNGVDGLKTGFTNEAGYCITTTAKKSDMRLISVVMGVETSEQRTADTTNLLNYGFNSYKISKIRSREDTLGKYAVILGKKESVEILLKEDFYELLKTSDANRNYNFSLNLGELKAPLKVGDKVGTVKVTDDAGNIIGEKDVTVGEDIEKISFGGQFLKVLKTILGGC